MTYKEHNGNYVLRLFPGEELIETLTKFCQEHNILGGWISGLGGSHNVVFGHYNESTHTYTPFAFDNESELKEITNITGNVSAEKLHIHITIGDHNGLAHTGHLMKCVANPTLEIFLTTFPEMHRKLDEPSGLALLDLEKTQ